MKALIIEDEQFAAKKLIKLIRQYDPRIEILDQIDTVEDSVEWLKNNPSPDLIFLDIHLADGSSFGIFEQTEVKSPIIFTTAYDQYAIQAFKTNSVDYLLKPVKFDELENAMNKFNQIFGQHSAKGIKMEMELLAAIIRDQKPAYKSRFMVKAGNAIKSIAIEEIAYFIFEDRTTLLVTIEKRRYPVKQTLDELESLLDPDRFNRANRQFIISIESIQKIHPWFKGRLKIELNPLQEADLVISAEKTKGFKEWLDR